MANRLADSLSPYLRQHADNPVDWREWSPEALQEAADNNRPILLSVGYAACHWCHVMAHESFENLEVAAAINQSFVAIKVDREERPDIDAAYMTATTAMTGSGGWPMTCLLTPDGKPFFSGTYLPKPQFLQLLSAAKHAWETQPDEVRASGQNVATQLAAAATRGASTALTAEVTANAVTTLRQSYDARYGGFGGAPSSRRPWCWSFCCATTRAPVTAMPWPWSSTAARQWLVAASTTSLPVASHATASTRPGRCRTSRRCSTTTRNCCVSTRTCGAPLKARLSPELPPRQRNSSSATSGRPTAASPARSTPTPRGSSTTYVWSPSDLRATLGDEDGRWAAELLGVTEEGTFEHGTSTLQLLRDPDDQSRWELIRTKLMDRRSRRPQPDRDEKVVTSWNGLAISALAEAAMILQESEWLDAAMASAEFALDRHLVDGRLRRTSLGGRVSGAPGVADDYGNFAEALLVLHQATGEQRYLAAGEQLLATAQQIFTGPSGGFHDAASAERSCSSPRVVPVTTPSLLGPRASPAHCSPSAR
ncbi:thioredoxin domain-containing protein [Flexivirga alba]|uniref:Thioredoxin domain-containing protein n=1 Tax=Flexivirga alba TaxID=702742 RepID=A0ABW2AMT9_9MICO